MLTERHPRRKKRGSLFFVSTSSSVPRRTRRLTTLILDLNVLSGVVKMLKLCHMYRLFMKKNPRPFSFSRGNNLNFTVWCLNPVSVVLVQNVLKTWTLKRQLKAYFVFLLICRVNININDLLTIWKKNSSITFISFMSHAYFNSYWRKMCAWY